LQEVLDGAGRGCHRKLRFGGKLKGGVESSGIIYSSALRRWHRRLTGHL
jgi:hypothetical protein